MFDMDSGVSEIAWQEIVIKLQNVVSCVEFWMGHPGL